MIHNKYFEIMGQFLGNYSREIYGRELVKKVKISQKNIALTLNELEGEGILSSKTRGNVKYYYLNKQNSLINNYIVICELERTIEFLKSHKKIAQLFNKINQNAEIVCIFGSYAKGIDKQDSDLDLFTTGKIDEKEIRKLGEVYNTKISIKGGSYSDFRSSLKSNNPLMNEILQNHIIIKGFEKFVSEVIKQKW